MRPELPDDIDAIVRLALQEDIGSGDITAALLPESRTMTASVISRETAIFCGTAWGDEILRQVDPRIQVEWLKQDGDQLEPDSVICRLAGPARSLLTAERTLLNFLQTLSGTATRSRFFASQVAHTGVALLDTRKTLPGLRSAQKYAVRVGGCHNHRQGLYDGFLIKENHIESCGGIAAAVQQARKQTGELPVEVEVRNLDELGQAIAAGADIAMLDNFSLQATGEAVALAAGRIRLEASGGIEEATLAKIAETGVDYISIGALTKHCQAVDLSMLVDTRTEA